MDYIPANEEYYLVCYADKDFESEDFANDTSVKPIDVVDFRTTKEKKFYTEEEAKQFVIKYLESRKEDLEWLAYIVIQKVTREVIKDFDKLMVMI